MGQKKGKKRTVLAPVLTQAVLWHFITRGIGKQRVLPASSSFRPISISCGLPIATSTPNVPPQLKQILSVLRGKVLTHSTKANLSGCVGIAAQRWAPPGAKWTGTGPLHFTPARFLNWSDQNQQITDKYKAVTQFHSVLLMRGILALGCHPDRLCINTMMHQSGFFIIFCSLANNFYYHSWSNTNTLSTTTPKMILKTEIIIRFSPNIFGFTRQSNQIWAWHLDITTKSLHYTRVQQLIIRKSE